MNERLYNILLISSKNQYITIEQDLAHYLNHHEVMLEDSQVSTYIAIVLGLEEKLKSLLQSTIEIFKRASSSNMNTIPATELIHEMEMLMIELQKTIHMEVFIIEV